MEHKDMRSWILLTLYEHRGDGQYYRIDEVAPFYKRYGRDQDFRRIILDLIRHKYIEPKRYTGFRTLPTEGVESAYIPLQARITMEGERYLEDLRPQLKPVAKPAENHSKQISTNTGSVVAIIVAAVIIVIGVLIMFDVIKKTETLLLTLSVVLPLFILAIGIYNTRK